MGLGKFFKKLKKTVKPLAGLALTVGSPFCGAGAAVCAAAGAALSATNQSKAAAQGPGYPYSSGYYGSSVVPMPMSQAAGVIPLEHGGTFASSWGTSANPERDRASAPFLQPSFLLPAGIAAIGLVLILRSSRRG